MKPEYDFTKAKKNPYAKLFKRQITIRLDEEVVRYFKSLAAETGVPYQNLIKLYLKDCVRSQRRLKWAL